MVLPCSSAKLQRFAAAAAPLSLLMTFAFVAFINPLQAPSGACLKTQVTMERKFYVELVYNDESEMHFNVLLDDCEKNSLSTLMMITRGTLMASMAVRATAYNDQGFDVCSYQK